MIVDSVDDINLIEHPGEVFICDGNVLTTQAVFEAKYQRFTKPGCLEMWVILARFCNEHIAIR